MVKAFDPDKFRKQAQDAIAANTPKRKNAVASLEKAQASLAKVQKRVDTAQAKVDAIDAEVQVSRNYLDRTANLDAADENKPGSGVESAEEFGTPTVGNESDPSDEDVAAASTGPAFSA